MNQLRKTPTEETVTFQFNDRYELIEGPGHSWLKVPHAEILRLKIAGKISSYSYMDAESVYLEEDIDMGIFIRARAGLPTNYRQCSPEDDLKAREFCTNSVDIIYHEQPFVRQLPHYKAHKLTENLL